MSYINPVPIINDYVDNKDKEESEQDYLPKKEVYFAFIDVLGFKKAFEDLKISKKEESISKYRDVFNYYFELMNSANFMEPGLNTGCYAGQTSDSLYFYTERIDYLVQFLKIFMHFNLYSMSKDVFFRGGIAKGTLYTKKKYQYYGDSVIGAYLLESKISKYPIIVLDEETFKDVKKDKEIIHFLTTKEERHYIKPFEFLKSSVKLDIDHNFRLKEINEDLLLNNIMINKKKFEYDDKNFSKYVFLQKEFIKKNEKKNNGF